MPGKLDRYRSMRNFGATPEPAGDGEVREAAKPTFVVQEHHARRLHWDFRLERDGVLVSWALPRGLPADPKQNHLAVHTEDHPFEYGSFEGQIPAGHYGAGKVTIWDNGTYDLHKWRDREVMITLHGKKVSGRYVLFQTGGQNWMIHRMDPEPGPSREKLPAHVEPMLAKLSGRVPPDDDRYAFEIKWDGIRAIAYVSTGRVRLESRRGNDISGQYPEIRRLGLDLTAHECVLDGEIVALDEQGRPSFERLQRRMGLGSESQVRSRMKEVAAAYVIFDLLWLDGHSLLALPYTARREMLEKLDLNGPAWRTPAYHAGDGAAMLAASLAQGLEGVIAKRLDSRYEPGGRSSAWLKVKNHVVQDLLIAGWTPRKGAGAAGIGALLLGHYDVDRETAERSGQPQQLIYAGRAGTGYTEAEAKRLMGLMEPLVRATSPFATAAPEDEATFIEPELVARVAFSEWTEGGVLRQPAYKGTRTDVDPRSVVRE